MQKLVLVFVFFLNVLFQVNIANGQSALEITESDFVIGKKDAPITIIEYASLSCSHCAKFHNETLEQLKKEYVDTGKVKIVFRRFEKLIPNKIWPSPLKPIR